MPCMLCDTYTRFFIQTVPFVFLIYSTFPQALILPNKGLVPQGADVTAQDQEKVKTYFPLFLCGLFILLILD